MSPRKHNLDTVVVGVVLRECPRRAGDNPNRMVPHLTRELRQPRVMSGGKWRHRQSQCTHRSRRGHLGEALQHRHSVLAQQGSISPRPTPRQPAELSRREVYGSPEAAVLHAFSDVEARYNDELARRFRFFANTARNTIPRSGDCLLEAARELVAARRGRAAEGTKHARRTCCPPSTRIGIDDHSSGLPLSVRATLFCSQWLQRSCPVVSRAYCRHIHTAKKPRCSGCM